MDYAPTHTDLSMAGKIRTKEKCPKCTKKFTGEPLCCADCKTHPQKFFLDLPYKNRRYKYYTDKQDRPLTSWDHAVWLSQTIDTEIKAGTFDPKDYLPDIRRELAFSTQVKKWLNSKKKKGRSPTYTCNLESYVKRFYLPYFRSRNITEIRTSDIDSFHEFLLDHKKKFKEGLEPEGLKPKTIKNILDGLRQFFYECSHKDLIQRLPRFERVEVPEYDWGWYDMGTQDAIIAQIPEHHQPIFIFLARHALRSGEVMALDWSDIEFERQSIRIARTWIQVKGGYQIKETTKESNIRYLPLHGDSFKWMTANRGISGALFRQISGKRYTHSILHHWWKKGCEAAKVEYIPLKDGTRHSVASQAINRGVGLDIIGPFLGHKDIRTTHNRYAHRKLETLRSVLSPDCPPGNEDKTNLLKINKKST